MELTNTIVDPDVTGTREGIIMLNSAGIITACNDTASKLIHPHELIIGKSILDTSFVFIHPDTLKQIELDHLPWILTLNSGITTVDTVLGISLENNQYRWLSLSCQWVRNQGSPLVLLSFFDSTKIINQHIAFKKKEQQINERKFNQAFHYSGIGMSITGLDGYCMDVNSSLCQMLAYSKEELLHLSFIEFTHPEDIEQDIALREKLLKNEIESFTIEKRYLHKQGYYVPCDTTVSLVRNQLQQPQFYIVQIQNISQAKQNIEILEQQKAELESIKLDLETKVRQLQDFNQIVTHNLKGPACNIQTLIHEIDHEPNLERKNIYFSLLTSSSEELTNSLDELTSVLELKIEHKHASENCNIHSHIKTILKKYEKEVDHKNAVITTHLEVEQIWYPKSYLKQILDILINNALKFTKVGRQPKIAISTYQNDGNTYLKISDNGIGIDLSLFKSQVFMFKKVFHRGYESRGVGLFTCRYLVENAGGKIQIESLPTVGSTFLIQF